MPRKQKDLPAMKGKGVERQEIQAIDDASDSYVAARDARLKSGLEEQHAKKVLIDLMNKYGLAKYEYEGRIVILEPTDFTLKVKVKPEYKEDET